MTWTLGKTGASWLRHQHARGCKDRTGEGPVPQLVPSTGTRRGRASRGDAAKRLSDEAKNEGMKLTLPSLPAHRSLSAVVGVA